MEYKDRGKLVAILDNDGCLMTFFAWNQMAERDSAYLECCKQKMLNLLENGYDIALEDWNEYTADFVQFLSSKNKLTGHIFLTGDNWELSVFYSQYERIEKNSKQIRVTKEGIFYPTEEKIVYSLKKVNEVYLHKSVYFYLGLSKGKYDYTKIAKYIFTFGTMPDGFCKLRSGGEEQFFLGRDVVDLETLGARPDILVVTDADEIDEVKGYLSESQMVEHYDRLFLVNRNLLEKKEFQTWGSDKLWEIFRKKTIWENIQALYKNQENLDTADGILLWEFMNDQSPEQYAKYMGMVNHNVKLYSLDSLYETPRWSSSIPWFLWDLEKIAAKGRNIILYGIKSHYTNVWMHILVSFDISFEIMEDKEIPDWYGMSVRSIHEIAYEDTEQLMVILNKPYSELRMSVELLEGYGVSREKHNCISLYEQIKKMNMGANMIDICAGPIPELLGKQDVSGYYIIGTRNENNFKILTVGGSTSDSAIFQYNSWPEELHELFEKMGIDVTIYSGGMSGAYSMQELSKILRDTRVLNPDIIISFSGINDVGGNFLPRGYVNGANGTSRSYIEKPFENWLENEKLMKLAADKWNAKFYCFAQPKFYLNKKYIQYMDFYPRGFYEESIQWKNNVKAVKGYPWFIDSTDILDEHPEVYFDACHVTTEGNRIIAEHIFEHIKNDII